MPLALKTGFSLFPRFPRLSCYTQPRPKIFFCLSSWAVNNLYFSDQGELIDSFCVFIILFQIKALDKTNVYLRDSIGVREKLQKMYEAGPEKLQVCMHDLHF